MRSGVRLMADAYNFPSEKSACEENIESREELGDLPADSVRIVLFKEGRLKECQLLFDSTLFYKGDNGIVNSHDNFSNTCKKQTEENLHLIEMIFGSTAMSYNDTYFKMHDVSSPHRVIFTQVFPMPHRRIVRQRDRGKAFSSNLLLDESRSKELDKLDSNLSFSSESSIRGSTLQSLLSLTNTSSTTTTMDSGFGEQYSTSDFSSSSGLSLSQAMSSWSIISSSNLNSTNSLLDQGRKRIRCPRLGLALIIPYSEEKRTYLDFFMGNINFVHAILNLMRKYVDIAYRAPEVFISAMLEISHESAHWLSNTSKTMKNAESEDCNDQAATSTIGLSSFGKTLRRKLNLWRSSGIHLRKRVENGLFHNILAEVETKDRNFFLSTILTTVLTYHPGWIQSCFKSSQTSGFVPRNSYNTLWWQLMDVCQTFGRVNINSKIVISGCDGSMIDRILNFIRYFIRYNKVVKQDLQRVDVSEDNRNVDMICDGLDPMHNEQPHKGIYGTLRKTKTACFNLSNFLEAGCDISESHSSQHDKSVMFILGDDERLVDLKKTDLSTKIYKSNFSEKGGTLTRSKKRLSALSSLIDEDDSCILHDKSGSNQMLETDVMRLKMKVLTFPLPKIKTSDFSETFSFPLALRKCSFEKLVPDILLQGTVIPIARLVDELRYGLSSQTRYAGGDIEEEAVAILGDAEKWTVKVITNKRYSIRGSSLCENMDPSDLISGMLDVLLQMGNLGIPKQCCMTHVEQKLLEICLRSKALAKFLINVEFGSIDLLVSVLDIKVSDIPLLMAVASQLEPEVSQKYGLSYQ